VSAVSNESSLLNMEEVSIGPSVDKISKKSILDAQKQDQVVGRLLTFLKTEKRPRSWETKHGLPATGVLSRQRRKLYCGKDGLFLRRSGLHSQLFLHQRFHTLHYYLLRTSSENGTFRSPSCSSVGTWTLLLAQHGR